MLHNTGQYGPNDVPIVPQPNMMTGRVNIGHNLTNLDKMPQHPPPMNSHYNLPEYSPYGINMNAGLTQFHSFHPVGFSQSNIHNWQNNAMPMNLMHNQLGYGYGKPDDYKECNKMLNVPQVHTKAFHKQMGMDIDNYHHLSSPYRHYTDYTDLSSKQKLDSHLEQTRIDERNYPHYLEQNLDLSKQKMVHNYTKPVSVYQNSQISIMANKHDVSNLHNIDLSTKTQKYEEKIKYPENVANSVKPPESLPFLDAHLDLSKPQKAESSSFQYNSDYNSRFFKDQDSRRRSLENTVKMIENILSHSSNTRKSDNYNQDKLSSVIENTNNKSKETELLSKNSNKISENHIIESSCNSSKNDYIATNSITEMVVENPSNDKPENSSLEQNNENVNNDTENNESSDEFSSDDDVKPDVDKAHEEAVQIKIELVPSIVDMEHLNPFLRDTFGVRHEDIGDNDIVDSEKSITLAKEVVRNKIQVTGAFFECPHCTLYFSSPKRFLIHTKWHTFGLTNEKRIEMQKEKEMKRHMKKEARVMERMNQNEVTDVNAPGRKFGCKECDKVFSAKASLKNHKQRYHPSNRSRNCKICGKVLTSWNALRAHLTTHTCDAGYQCDDCPKRFKHPHSLAKHRDTHLEKTHECQQCPKKFGSAALLNVHMKTHERVLRGATFRCTYCGKGFFESYSLQVHERTHRNERPYLCEICNTSFGTNSSLKRHLKVSHSTSKPYQCSTCHRNFMSEAIRDRHMLRNHGNPEDFKFLCKQCPCKYLKLKDLRKHTYKAHPKGKRKKKVLSDSE